jgi:FKBP-type peptidyl-prolyl cis-trans isomerase FklB
MKIHSIAALLIVCNSTMFAAAQTPATLPGGTASQPTGSIKTDKEKMSYALGLQIGESFKGLDLDIPALAAGMRDTSTGAKPQLTDKEIEDSLMALKQLATAKAAAEQTTMADSNQKAGDAFLAENGKKEGVKTTASGLQYKVLKSGVGKSPKATDTVSVNYRGTLITGKEFDASHGTPVSFPVNQVIPGWTEALQLMKEGDTWELYIPAKLAYADRGAGPDIGPNSVLIFQVELLQVKADK